LPAVYRRTKRNLVLRCSRQTEKSTFLANSILYEASTNPGITMLLVAPRFEQARIFCHTRLLQCLEDSLLLRRKLVGSRTGKLRVTHMTFANGSQLFVRAAFRTADSCRGLSVRRLYIDEYQDIAPHHLPVLQETLSHAKDGRTILAGTPKSVDNCLEAAYAASTANEWTITCEKCRKGVIHDLRCLGACGIVCPECQVPVDSRWGSGSPATHSPRGGTAFGSATRWCHG
jgi:phage terminase large subunit GpA-like protein